VRGDTIFSNITGRVADGQPVCSVPNRGCGFGSVRQGQLLAAAAFRPTATYMMTDAQVLVFPAETVGDVRNNHFDVFLYSDSNGVPGSIIQQIGSDLAATTPISGSIVIANTIATPITLTSGIQYWLVLAAGSGDFIYWASGGSPSVPVGSIRTFTTPNPQWSVGTGSLQFQIDGVPVPQTSTVWSRIVGVITAPGVSNPVAGIPSGGLPWTTTSGTATINLTSGAVTFNVEGLVLVGGNASGTPDGVTSVKGTLVCNPGATDQAVIDTPAVPLSSRGNAEFSGNFGSAPPPTCINNPLFLIRAAPANVWIATGAVRL
jgi:hypothetical protein